MLMLSGFTAVSSVVRSEFYSTLSSFVQAPWCHLNMISFHLNVQASGYLSFGFHSVTKNWKKKSLWFLVRKLFWWRSTNKYAFFHLSPYLRLFSHFPCFGDDAKIMRYAATETECSTTAWTRIKRLFISLLLIVVAVCVRKTGGAYAKPKQRYPSARRLWRWEKQSGKILVYSCEGGKWW